VVPSPHILVVDDNQALRENIAEALLLEGYAVEEAGTGAQALELLARDPLPGVVLIDMMMPGMSGRELVEQVRREPRLAALKVVLVSGMSPTREPLQVDAVLGKPFGVADLLRTVERLLRAPPGSPAQPPV
jgi:CheY-like chemotaxis protein